MNRDTESHALHPAAERRARRRQQRVTSADVRSLLASRGADPVLVRWQDTGALDVVPRVLFSDVSYVHRRRPHTVVVSQADLRQSGDLDWDTLSDDDAAAVAAWLNETV